MIQETNLKYLIINTIDEIIPQLSFGLKRCKFEFSEIDLKTDPNGENSVLVLNYDTTPKEFRLEIKIQKDSFMLIFRLPMKYALQLIITGQTIDLTDPNQFNIPNLIKTLEKQYGYCQLYNS